MADSTFDFDHLTPEDFNDPDIEEAWIQHMRRIASDYLRTENVYFRALDDKPAWHLAPITSVWAVESTKDPGYVGWWAFCGDHPCDYISSSVAQTPRDALRVLGRNWQDLCGELRAGREPSDRSVGPRETWPEVIALLEPRAEHLLALTKDKNLWG